MPYQAFIQHVMTEQSQNDISGLREPGIPRGLSWPWGRGTGAGSIRGGVEPSFSSVVLSPHCSPVHWLLWLSWSRGRDLTGPGSSGSRPGAVGVWGLPVQAPLGWYSLLALLVHWLLWLLEQRSGPRWSRIRQVPSWTSQGSGSPRAGPSWTGLLLLAPLRSLLPPLPLPWGFCRLL